MYNEFEARSLGLGLFDNLEWQLPTGARSAFVGELPKIWGVKMPLIRAPSVADDMAIVQEFRRAISDYVHSSGVAHLVASMQLLELKDRLELINSRRENGDDTNGKN